MPTINWIFDDPEKPHQENNNPNNQDTKNNPQGDPNNLPEFQISPELAQLREDVLKQIRDSNQSSEEFQQVLKLTVDGLIQQFQALEQQRMAFGNVQEKIQQVMDLAMQRSKELMPKPPEEPTFTKNESIALFLSSLINWRAAGIASQQLLQQKQRSYESQFEKYKVMSQLALDEYNKTMTRISAISQQMAQFEVAAAQRQNAIMQTLSTLFPQLENIRYRKERDALMAMMELYRTDYQYQLEQHKQEGILNMKLKEFVHLQQRVALNLYNTAVQAGNPALARMALALLQQYNPIFELPVIREAGEELYQSLLREQNLRFQRATLDNLLRDAQVQQTLAQARLTRLNADLVEKFGARLQELQIQKVEAQIKLTEAQRQFLQDKGAALLAKNKNGDLDVKDVATLVQLSLLGIAVSQNESLISDADKRRELRDLSLQLYFAAQNQLGQIFPQFNTQPPQVPQRSPQSPTTNPLFGTGGYSFGIQNPYDNNP